MAPEKFQLENGQATTAQDPNRVMWFSALCGYYTDDWAKLGRLGQHAIPCCPVCRSPGMICTMAEWEEGVEIHEKIDPGYQAFLAAHREQCLSPINMSVAWTAEKKRRSDEK